MPDPLRIDGPRVLLLVKVVPGASRSRVAGLLGDRLKVQVAAPPESGRANAALCALIADAFGLPIRNVQLIDGHHRPQKTLALAGQSFVTIQTSLDSLLGHARHHEPRP